MAKGEPRPSHGVPLSNTEQEQEQNKNITRTEHVSVSGDKSPCFVSFSDSTRQGTTQKNTPPDPIADALSKSGEKVAWDKVAVDNAILPEFAAAFCGERKNRKAIGIYGTCCRKIGPDAFREELATFIDECNAGEAPENLGAAFMKRVTTRCEHTKGRQTKAKRT
jgi:hypothetical protein